jgi:alkylation response protein AidB-like acyl-CoA dehydrogenase
MDFSLNAEQAELLDLVGTVADRSLRPKAFERIDVDEPPRENLRLLAETGILGLHLPEEVGGAGRSALEVIMAIERIAQACPSTAEWMPVLATGPALFISRLGTPYLKERYIPGIIAGETLCSISLTEPEAGSALTDLKAAARFDGDEVVLDGNKIFCSFAPFSDWFLVFVRFGPGTRGIGAVIVDRGTPGFTIGKKYTHMGGTSWAELSFSDARIPARNVLADGDVFGALMQSYSLERCSAAALTLGIAQFALDLSVEHVVSREQFGRPLLDFQMVQRRLADMYIAIAQARLLMYQAVSGGDGLPTRVLSSAAKVAATEAASFVTDQAMQLHGGAGMSKETGLEWLYRMVRPYQVAGGASDIHRSSIAGELTGRRIDHRGRS